MPSTSAKVFAAVSVCPCVAVPVMVTLPVGASLMLATVSSEPVELRSASLMARFTALGEQACKVTFELEFELQNRLLGMAVGKLFESEQ